MTSSLAAREAAVARLLAECESQGHPRTVADRVALDRVAAIIAARPAERASA